jgi:hypothetical protein
MEAVEEVFMSVPGLGVRQMIGRGVTGGLAILATWMSSRLSNSDRRLRLARPSVWASAKLFAAVRKVASSIIKWLVVT